MTTRIIYGDIVFKEGEAHVVRITHTETVPEDYTDALDQHAEDQAKAHGGDWLMPDVYEGRITYAQNIDPHQAAEAAAFSLMPSTGPAPVDTTADMFGYDSDDLQHWQASRCAPRLRQPSVDSLGLFD